MRTYKLTIGIVGCGTIGATLAKKMTVRAFPGIKQLLLCDVDATAVTSLLRVLKRPAQAANRATVLAKSDMIIEAASAAVSGPLAMECLRRHKDILVMSVGGLLPHLRQLEQLTQRSRGTVYIPSGAIAGIDAALAARCSRIDAVTLTTRKPIAGLRGAPYFKLKGIALDRITTETVVFEGPAREAIKYFPANVNVAAVLSLATCGSRRTRVRIMTSPTYTCNSHEVVVEGAFGRITALTENVPSPTNPKTSYLAILAAEALLKKILSRLKIGT